MNLKDTVVIGLIYLITLGYMLHYNLTHILVNDGVWEYRIYLSNISEGWAYRTLSINSCIIPLWLPAVLQRLIHVDSFILFRIYPPIFYALMPTFVYIVARRYLSQGLALMAVLTVAFNSYVSYFPDIGRVGIALGFLAVTIWALLAHRTVWASIFSALVVFSHYGTTLILVLLIVIGLLVSFIWSRRLLRQYLIVASVLLPLTIIWHFGIAQFSGASITEATALGLTEVVQPTAELWNLNSRDVVVQQAFSVSGKSIPQLIELLTNWTVIGCITLGVYLLLRDTTVDVIFKYMMLCLYGLIFVVMAVPTFSMVYGVQRTYFTSLVVLAICLPVGLKGITTRIHIPCWSISVPLLLLYGLSTSGILYTFFSLSKS